jgi:hypothetical protein
MSRCGCARISNWHSPVEGCPKARHEGLPEWCLGRLSPPVQVVQTFRKSPNRPRRREFPEKVGLLGPIPVFSLSASLGIRYPSGPWQSWWPGEGSTCRVHEQLGGQNCTGPFDPFRPQRLAASQTSWAVDLTARLCWISSPAPSQLPSSAPLVVSSCLPWPATALIEVFDLRCVGDHGRCRLGD